MENSVFFFYGLVFFCTGCTAIFIRLANNTRYAIFNKFSYLAGFFIFRGIAQWEHMFFPLYFYQLTEEMFIVNLGHRLLTSVAAFFLLAFAFEVCILLNKKLRFLRGMFFIIFLIFFVYIFIYPAGIFFSDIIHWSITIESISEKYILFPAGIIAALSIFIYSKKLHMPKISLSCLRLFSLTLLYYALHIGVFISNNKHISDESFIDVFYKSTGFNISFIEIGLALIFLCIIFTSWYFTNKADKKQHLEIHDSMLLSNEQERIAHDLHDGVIQTLFGLSLKLKHVSNQVDNTISEDDCEYLKGNIINIQQELACSVNDIRDYIYNNVSNKIQYEDIAGCIEGIITEFNKITPIQFKFAHSDNSHTKLSRNIFMHVYFIAREAIMNIIKHSDATQCEIFLIIDEDNLFLSIKDNGIGFQQEHAGGLGLASITERIEKLHGSFELSDNHGVYLEINIPLD